MLIRSIRYKRPIWNTWYYSCKKEGGKIDGRCYCFIAMLHVREIQRRSICRGFFSVGTNLVACNCSNPSRVYESTVTDCRILYMYYLIKTCVKALSWEIPDASKEWYRCSVNQQTDENTAVNSICNEAPRLRVGSSLDAPTVNLGVAVLAETLARQSRHAKKSSGLSDSYRLGSASSRPIAKTGCRARDPRLTGRLFWGWQ